MPLEKPRDTQRNPAKPLMPTLASSRNVKSPLTPRLAGSNSSATPPLAKSRSTTPATVRSPPPREDLSTPAKAFISTNVTPRSGSRKSRVDSNHTTPTSTPNGTRQATPADLVSSGGRQPQFGSLGLGITGSGNKSRPTSVVGGSASPGTASQSRFFEHNNHSMFFNADDIRASPETLAAAPAVKKSPVFFYANGEQDESQQPISQPSPPLSSISTRSKKSQFLHADGRADDDVPPVPSLPSPSAGNLPQFFQNAPAFRPPSPAKDVNIHLSYRKGVSQIMRPADTRPKTMSILPPTSADFNRKRSISSGTSKAAPHKRTSSLSSIESGASARKVSATDMCGLTPLQTILQEHSPLAPEPLSAPPTGFPFPSTGSDALAERISSPPLREREHSVSSPLLSVPQSPTKGPGGWQTQVTESVMNARVERKIQDLEISNSSLMAINKSLEKEVRRQNKELRRFRRLSRAGRLSLASAADSLGTAGDEYEGPALGQDLSVLDELSGEDEESEPEEESSDESSSDNASLSASAFAEREERKLAKDSRRLQLDLAKHREILVDSQKMNQSLKRCMAWTELMIKDGRKALDYKAEAEIGGRILDQDDLGDGAADEDEDGEPRHSLLSSWTPNPMPALESLDGILGIDTAAITRRSWLSEEGADSGIEVESARGSKAIIDSGPGAELEEALAAVESFLPRS